MSTELDGLSQAQVSERLQKGQVNRTEQRTSRPFWQIIRANVFTRFNALLGSLLAVVLIVGPWQDALFGGVLVVNSLIGIIQELRAKRTLNRLALLAQVKTRVIRAGQTVEIATSDIGKRPVITPCRIALSGRYAPASRRLASIDTA